MKLNDVVLYWINVEIPMYLNKKESFEEFDKCMPSAAASSNWKIIAYAMAKERWGRDKITYIPS